MHARFGTAGLSTAIAAMAAMAACGGSSQQLGFPGATDGGDSADTGSGAADSGAPGLFEDVGAQGDDGPSLTPSGPVTDFPTPIFDGTKVKPGTHINGIGSHSPGARELDTAIIQRSLLIADSREACLKEAGDIMMPLEAGEITEAHIHAELGEVVAGKASGRANDEQITLFKSNGLAIQDAATAKLVFDRAREKGVGTAFDL